MTILSRETHDADAAAHAAAAVRDAAVRAGAAVGAVLSLSMLGLMFAATAAHADDWYLVQSGSAALHAGAPHRAGVLLTLALLGVGLSVLGVGIIEGPRAPAVRAPFPPRSDGEDHGVPLP